MTKEIEKKMEEIVIELKNQKTFIQAECTLLKMILTEIKELKRGMINGDNSRK